MSFAFYERGRLVSAVRVATRTLESLSSVANKDVQAQAQANMYGRSAIAAGSQFYLLLLDLYADSCLLIEVLSLKSLFLDEFKLCARVFVVSEKFPFSQLESQATHFEILETENSKEEE